MANKVYLGLGSNIGEREKNLFDAIKKISELSGTNVISCSHIYDTKPVGFLSQENFLNMVIEIDTEMGPYDLLNNLHTIEISFNRIREIKWGPRIIDLDILVYEDLRIELPGLIIPHPRMFERAFTLVPLKDIYCKESIMGKNIDDAIVKCSDASTLKVHKRVSDLFKLRYNMNTRLLGKDLLYFEEIDSTNTLAKKMAPITKKEGLLIIAEEQKRGRGRLGRTWDSKYGEGIWMSILLKPKFDNEHKRLLPLVAALSVVESIKNITGIKTTIKWPNDVILAGRKVCGVLCESVVSEDNMEDVIVGIGLNANHDDFAPELRDKAISLKQYSGERIDRGELTGEILRVFEDYYEHIDKYGVVEILEQFKTNAITIGSKVRVVNQRKEYFAVAIDINKNGNLVVLNEEGNLQEIFSGEVSVRGVLGYT